MYRLTAINYTLISVFTLISLVQNERYYLIIPVLLIIGYVGFIVKISLTGSSLDFFSYFFLNFLSIGVFLKLGFHLYEFGLDYHSVYFSYGDFEGKNINYIEALCYCLLGTIAFAASKICFESVVGKQRSCQTQYKKTSNLKSVIIIVSLFIGSWSLSRFMYFNEVGIHGVTPQTLYFAGVSGTLVYLRWILIPMLWYYAYERLVRNNNNFIKSTFLILFLLWAVIYLIHTQTKAAIILFSLPLFINAFEKNNENFGLKRYIFTILMLSVGLISMVFIGASRSVLFQKLDISYFEIFKALPLDAYFSIFKSLSVRIEGFREVAAVNSINSTNIFDLVDAIAGGFDVAGRIYNTSIAYDGYSFGMTLGLLGTAALGQNVFVFFGYIFVTFFLLFVMVNLVTKKAGALPFYYCGCVLLILVWSGISMFFVIRIFAMILLFNFILYLLDGYNWTKRT